MIAAIYARKSTGQNVAEDAKSVTRQVENAKAFAAKQGWTVDDRFIFVDDGISGAETRRLVEKQRMLDLIRDGAPFDVVVMQAQDRFSRRDGAEAVLELRSMARSGVEVWFYTDGQRFGFGTFASNLKGFVDSEFAAEFRRNIASKTHEAMVRRAKAGHVTGGKVFGYDNVRKDGHVERILNESEAKVVREIYRRYADGEGFKQITHALNARRLPSPRPQRGRPAGWTPSTIRAVLKRSLYRGTIVYNRTTKRDSDGSRHRGRQPKKDEAKWITVDAPQVRIIDADLAEAVDDRLLARRTVYLRTTKGRLLGRPVEGRYLLAGFLQCECGARFEAVRRGRQAHAYVCAARRRKGPSVCPSEVVLPVEATDRIFLDVIEGTVLHPDFIDRVVEATFAARPDDERAAWLQERQRLATEITHLTSAIAQGGDIPALVKRLQERDRDLKSLDAKLAKPVVEPLDREVLRAALKLREGQWKDVLRGPHVAQARLVLQHLVELPMKIRFDYDKPPRWVTQTRPGGLLSGLIQSLASPPGFEPGFQP